MFDESEYSTKIENDDFFENNKLFHSYRDQFLKSRLMKLSKDKG